MSIEKSIFVTRTADNIATPSDGRVIQDIDVDIIHAAVAGTAANAFPGPISQPDVPRILTASFGATWDGGDITIVGTDTFGKVVTETIADSPAATVPGTQVFATVTSISKQTVGVDADTVTIGVATGAPYYSIPWGKPDSINWSVHIETTGTLTGTWSLWLSNKPNPSLANDADWAEDTAFPETNPAGAATEYVVAASNSSFARARLKYVNTSGAGSILAWVVVPRSS